MLVMFQIQDAILTTKKCYDEKFIGCIMSKPFSYIGCDNKHECRWKPHPHWQSSKGKGGHLEV